MVMPSPDWNPVTLKWAGTLLDGSPTRGSLELTYNGGVRLDDDPTNPIAVFPSRITVPITETTILINGENRLVGYAEVQVQASNDPDISGSGATYTLTEKLISGNGRSNINFVADIDAPGGVIWLNKITPTNPQPGGLLTVVYYSDFVELADRVEALESTSGGASTWDKLTDKPTEFPPADHTHPIVEVAGLQTALDGKQASGSYATSADLTTELAGKANATHAHAVTDVAGLQTALDGKQASGSYATSADLTTELAGKANATHAHAVTDVAGLQTALDGKQASGSYAPTTHTHTAANISDSTTTGRSVLTATDEVAARAAISAGTSSVTVGTGATNAKAGNYKPPVADLPAGTTLTVININGTQARPTSRTDIFVRWVGGTIEPANGLANDVWEKDVAP